MKKLHLVIMILLVSLGLTGCAATLKIKENSFVYGMPMIKNAPKIIIGDFVDYRVDKRNIGNVCLVSLKTGKGINMLLTDRIAARLRNEGFNIQKVNAGGEEREIETILYENNGDIYLTGDLTDFNVNSFDAIMEKARGSSAFKVEIYDITGILEFEGRYNGYAENWIGLTGASGGAKTVEKTLDASVGALFRDRAFKDLLQDL